MAKKILLNIVFNIAILTLGLCIIWLFDNRHYPLLVAAIFALSLFIYLKVRLVKSVKELARKKAAQRKT